MSAWPQNGSRHKGPYYQLLYLQALFILKQWNLVLVWMHWMGLLHCEVKQNYCENIWNELWTTNFEKWCYVQTPLSFHPTVSAYSCIVALLIRLRFLMGYCYRRTKVKCVLCIQQSGLGKRQPGLLAAINSSPPSATYMHQWIGSAFVQIMACHLISAKPFSKPMLGCC